MRTIIKGTKNIEEYKETRDRMEYGAAKAFETHQKACETWTHGNIDRVWYDHDNVLCVQYTDGQWWHYRHTADGIEWW